MSAPLDGGDRRPLAYYEAVPYLLVLESVERGAEWLRRAEHPRPPLGQPLSTDDRRTR